MSWWSISTFSWWSKASYSADLRLPCAPENNSPTGSEIPPAPGANQQHDGSESGLFMVMILLMVLMVMTHESWWWSSWSRGSCSLRFLPQLLSPGLVGFNNPAFVVSDHDQDFPVKKSQWDQDQSMAFRQEITMRPDQEILVKILPKVWCIVKIICQIYKSMRPAELALNCQNKIRLVPCPLCHHHPTLLPQW